MTTPLDKPIPCINCAHYTGLRPDDAHPDDDLYNVDAPVHNCRAFPGPDGIPESIMFNESDHRTPIEGDGGFQFEEIE